MKNLQKQIERLEKRLAYIGNKEARDIEKEALQIILALQQQIKEREEATNLLISRAMDMGEYIYIPIDDYDTALLSLLGNAGTCRYCGKKIGLSDYRGADVTGAFHVSCQSEALGTTHTAALPKEGECT